MAPATRAQGSSASASDSAVIASEPASSAPSAKVTTRSSVFGSAATSAVTDATAAAIGESLFGMGRRSANFAYLHLTNGFGGGIIANGRPFRGHHGNAGEFGGVWALLNEGYPSLDALRDVLAGHGSRFDTVDEMSASIDVATPGVAQWIEQAAPSFSMLAGLLTCIIDPEFIVLGGRLPAPIANALMDRVHIPSPGVRWGRIPPQPRLALAQVRVQPVATGAAALPMQRLFFG